MDSILIASPHRVFSKEILVPTHLSPEQGRNLALKMLAL